MLVVSPAVGYVVSPSRPWSRSKGMFLAILIMIISAVVQIKKPELNCYELLGLDRTVSSSDISRAFRRQSLIYHPDRLGADTPAPPGGLSVEGYFIELQKCSEILTNENKNSNYNKFGDFKEFIKLNEINILTISLFSFISIFIELIITYFITILEPTRAARKYIFSFLFFSFSIEILMRFLGEDNLLTFIPIVGRKWTIFEQIELIKDLFPFVLSSSILISSINYRHNSNLDYINDLIEYINSSNFNLIKYLTNETENPPATFPLSGIDLSREPPPPPQPGSDEDEEKEEEKVGIFGKIKKFIMNFIFILYFLKIVYNSFYE